MKQFEAKMCGQDGWKWFCGTGWLLAGLLSFWAAPRIYRHLIVLLPYAQRENWNQVVLDKKRELSSRWQDGRPLIVFAGDSEIESGDWYDLFAGACAVRNCGLSGAKIADVTTLVSAIGDPHPKMVVLMCGVNDFLRHGSSDTCLRDYEALLAAVRSHLQPEFILVLSVMPVRESTVDRAAHQLNTGIARFNLSLETCCRQHQVDFLDVKSAVTDANGGRASELTVDGLHLNHDGYRRLAAVIAPHLTLPAAP